MYVHTQPFHVSKTIHIINIVMGMACIVIPVTFFTRCYTGSRSLRYRHLAEDGGSERPVTVLVGKEKREFMVDPLVLEENPLWVLIDILKKENIGRITMDGAKRVIFVDVDAILFEHMIWLMQNDSSALLSLNLREIVDFYAQEN